MGAGINIKESFQETHDYIDQFLKQSPMRRVKALESLYDEMLIDKVLISNFDDEAFVECVFLIIKFRIEAILENYCL